MTLFEWMNIVSLKDQLNIILWWSTRLVDSEFVGSRCVMVDQLAPLSNSKIMKCFRKKDIACLSIWCCLERGWVFLKTTIRKDVKPLQRQERADYCNCCFDRKVFVILPCRVEVMDFIVILPHKMAWFSSEWPLPPSPATGIF